MDKLSGKHRDKLIDLLDERLVFERTGVRLYDAILEKMRASKDKNITRMLDQMQEHREHEKEHEEWLEEQIRGLGGDVTKPTDMARLVKRESKGIEEVILDGDPELPHLFHALFAAELVDNAGWDLLVQLAEEADDDDARRAFQKRLHEEEEHLTFMRRTMERLAQREVLGQNVPLPTED